MERAWRRWSSSIAAATRFLRLALAFAGSREAAADLVQEAFARALRARHGFRGEAPLEAWVWQILLNLARDQHRRPITAAADAFGEPLQAASTGNGNGHALGWPELRAALAALPERQREVMFLRHYGDLREEKIGRD